ncbi:anthranilate synthase component I family protein [Corynebacterium sp. HMSC27B11]|uniref:anthranilate synthase component I family protein n=1 Tax=Corynebacterium sp. HMSC27B11 TaxID=1581065 RepID=UPI0008A3C277|nr:anthranilate synthase component I family protein [Corynebacterium sp. HMSC27B11]OFS16756.1 para-aminobenzoate synthase [Corynebacterium sp. HMSC27B11]
MHYPWVSHAAGTTPDAGAAGVQPGSLTLRWRIFPISAGRGVSACQGVFRRAANTAFAVLRHQGGEAADAVFLDSGSAFQGDTARSFLAFSSARAAVRGAADGTVHSPVPGVGDDASAADGPGFAAAYRVSGRSTCADAGDAAAGVGSAGADAGNAAAFYDALREQLRRIHVPEDFPSQLTGGFALGWVGAFGYELKNLSPDVLASATRRGARLGAKHAAVPAQGAVAELGAGNGGAAPLRHHSHPDAALLFADRGLVFSPHDGAVIALALEPTGASGGPGGAPGDEPLTSPAPVTSPTPDASPAEAWFRQLEERFGTGLRELFPTGAGDSNAPDNAPRTTAHAAPSVTNRVASAPTEYRLDHGHEQYLANVLACQEHIAAGDSYELCLTTTARGPALGDPWGAYQQLRNTSPVPYGAYLQFPGLGAAPATDPGTASPSPVAVNPASRTAATQAGTPGLHVLSASPERFLRIRRAADVAGRLFVEAKPIKGTRPRGTGAEDERHRRELQNSEKDRAENLMIVDLLRNDLAKICRPGSVRVPELFAVESYSHVHQLVSTITGELDGGAGADAVDCLAACFPGGSMTGAPKVRSMELLEELEGAARGLYSGAIGWLSPTGEADLSITIRTLIDDGRESSFGVGGAIVADSDPEAEWQEILVKASALLEALGARIVGSA